MFTVGADEAKLVVTRRLGIERPGPGYCHFPDSHDPEYFAQLTAEKLVTRYVKGFPVREWHKTRERNEALDCRAYAMAALKIANPNLARLAERLSVPDDPEPQAQPTDRADGLRERLAEIRGGKPPEKPPEDKRPAKRKTRRIRKTGRAKNARGRGGWVNNW